MTTSYCLPMDQNYGHKLTFHPSCHHMLEGHQVGPKNKEKKGNDEKVKHSQSGAGSSKSVPKRNQHSLKCGRCGEVGHNVRTCYGKQVGDRMLAPGGIRYTLCHTPIFDLRSYIHIPSDLEYYLTFQNKNSAERYFKIPHFCSDSDPLLSLFLFLISFYFLLFYFSFIANTFFNVSKITCPYPKFEFQPRLNYRVNVQSFFPFSFCKNVFHLTPFITT